MGSPAGLEMALAVAARGWRVCPAFVSSDLKKIGATGWSRKATTDPVALRAWWKELRNPYSWWCGVVSGPGSCLVFDVDKVAAIERFRTLAQPWPSGGLLYRTPGPGLHSVWDWPSGLADFGRYVTADGIELRGGGKGYLTILIGAKRVDGEYELLEEPPAVGASAAPLWLVERVLAEPPLQLAPGVTGELKEISPSDAFALGSLTDLRKTVIAGLCWYVYIRGYVDAEEIVYRFNAEVCDPPLPLSLVAEKCKRAAEQSDLARAESEAIASMMAEW